MIGKLKYADIMMKRMSLLMRKAENSGMQTSRRRLNCDMGRRRSARETRHIRTGTNASVMEEGRIIGEAREEMSESRATTIKCVGGFDQVREVFELFS